MKANGMAAAMVTNVKDDLQQHNNLRMPAALGTIVFGLFFFAVRGTGEFFVELIDASFPIHEFLFARVERMAHVANIDFKFRLGRLGRKFISTTAGNLGFDILRMNVLLHNCAP